MEENKRRGLDETRRVLYIALAAVEDNRQPSDDAIGTITNALFHHHRELGFSYVEIDSKEWLNKAIMAITEQLGDGAVSREVDVQIDGKRLLQLVLEASRNAGGIIIERR